VASSALGTGVAGMAGAVAYMSLMTYLGDKKARKQLTDVLDDRDDWIDQSWRSTLKNMGREKAAWAVSNPIAAADTQHIDGNDPELAYRLKGFFGDLQNRMNVMGDNIIDYRTLTTRYVQTLGGDNLGIRRNEVKDAMDTRKLTLGWLKDGVVEKATQNTLGGSKSLLGWAKHFAEQWRNTANPDDYINVDVNQLAYDKATGVRTPLFDTSWGAEAERKDVVSKLRRNFSSMYELDPRKKFGRSEKQNIERNLRNDAYFYDRAEGYGVTAWLRGETPGEWINDDSWDPLDAKYFTIGLPGTGKPEYFHGGVNENENFEKLGWQSPTTEEFEHFMNL
jgi:hypothetical protein